MKEKRWFFAKINKGETSSLVSLARHKGKGDTNHQHKD